MTPPLYGDQHHTDTDRTNGVITGITRDAGQGNKNKGQYKPDLGRNIFTEHNNEFGIARHSQPFSKRPPRA